MPSTLDRLRAAAASSASTSPEASSTPTPAAAPASSQPVPVESAPVQPQPTPAPVESAPVQAEAVRVAEVIGPAPVPAQPVDALLPAAVDSGDAAQRALAAMFGGGAAQNAMSISAIAEDLDDGGVRESFPFASVRKGSWVAYNKIDPLIYDALPIGQRPYRMVYISHRLGAIGWAGPAEGSSKQPPLWAAVAPIPSVSQLAGELNRRILKIGSKIQYTAGSAREKFDAVGRLTPEIHVFGWRPDTGFIVLVCSTFKSTELSSLAFKNFESKGGVPIVLELGVEHQHNPRATDPKKRDWDVTYLKPRVELDKPAADLAQAFDALKSQDCGVPLAKECLKFARGEDYSGLNLTDLVAKLDQYNALI